MSDTNTSQEVGLSMLVPGFCFTPAQDRLFALGWPHVRLLVDGAKGDDSPARYARIWLSQLDPAPQIRWSRKVATSVVRVLSLPHIYEVSPDARKLRLEAARALLEEEPLRLDEAMAGIRVRMSREAPGVSERTIETFVLLLEAMIGTAAVAQCIVETLEGMSNEDLEHTSSIPPFITFQLGYLLLRLSNRDSEALRHRLRLVFNRLVPPRGRRDAWMNSMSHLRALDLVLHGSVAAERSTERTLRWYTHVIDNPASIRKRVAEDELGFLPDVRLGFLGGDSVMETVTRQWRSLQDAEEQRWFLEQISPIKSERVRQVMMGMATDSQVKDLAIQWFKAHTDYTQEWLEDMADRRDQRGAQADSVLNRMRAG